MAYTIDSTTVSISNGDVYDTHIGKPGGFSGAAALSYPCLIFLHGTGQTTLAGGLTVDAPTPITEANNGNMVQDNGGADWDIIISAPFQPPTAAWHAAQIRGAIDDIIDNAAALKVDVSQIYLCGLSLGAIGIHGWMFMDDQNIRWVDITLGRIHAVFPQSGSNYNLDASPDEDNAVTYGRFAKIVGTYGRNDANSWVTDADHSAPWGSTTMNRASESVNAIEADYYELEEIRSKFNYDNESGGPFTYNETLSWGTGGTAGTGRIMRLVDNGTTGTLWITLDSGVVPTDGLTLTGGTSSATADVNGSVSTPAHSADAWGCHYANHGDVSAGTGMYQFIEEQIDVAPPYYKATVEDASPTKITIIWDKWFNDSLTDPATTDFSVSGGRTINSLTVTGAIVELTVNTAYGSADSITFSYTAGTNKLTDRNGNLAANLSSEAVINNIIPEYVVGTTSAMSALL